MTWKRKKRPNSLLGLALDGGQLRAVHMARVKGSLKVVKSASAPLATDVFGADAAAAGLEIKGHLHSAGIKERSVAVALPANWVMTQHAKLPDLAAEDLDSFLQLEAEKSFPCDVAQLQVTRSFQKAAGNNYVTQLAVRKERLDQLSAVLKAAGLKPVSYSLGLATLPDMVALAGAGRISVAASANGVDLLVSAGGGIAALRSADLHAEADAAEGAINGAAVARELRITVEQLDTPLRSELREVRLYGDEPQIHQLSKGLKEWAAAASLTIERGNAKESAIAEQFAENVAQHWLAPTGSEIEFLPPAPGRMAVMMARYNSKRLATAGYAVGAVVLLVALTFGWQEFQLVSLRSEWGGMQEQVTALNAIQEKISDFHPWYDHSYPDLRILGRVSQCFPDNGSVTAKSFDVQRIPTGTIVTITGNASDARALLKTQDLLRQAKEVQGLKVEGISGKLPARFSFTFHWMGGSGS